MRMFRYFLPVLAGMAAVAACQKAPRELEPVVEPMPGAEESMLAFISERPQVGEGTRTFWDGETILWNESDWIRMGYTVAGEWQNESGNAAGDAKMYGSQGTTLTEEGAVAAFTIHSAFSGNTEGEHVFYAVYPGSATTSTMTDAPVTTVTVPSVQTPLAGSFDPSADLMLGHSVDRFKARPSEPVKLLWERVVAHGLITLKSLPETVSGEAVKSITLTAQPGADLTGAHDMNVVTGVYSPSAGNSTPNRIVLKGDHLTLEEGGNLTFWMSILPETLTSLTVEVVTDKATYTRTISGFSREFLANRRNILTINMENADRKKDFPSSGDVYSLVTDASGLGEGHYLIAYQSSGTAAEVLSGKASAGNYGAYAEVPVSSGQIAFDDAGAYDVVIRKTANGYSLQQGTVYLGYTSESTSGNNYLYFSETFEEKKYEWSISMDSEGNVVLTNVYNTVRSLRWNSGSPRFACYTSGQQPICLYRWSDPVPTVVTAPATGMTVSSATVHATFSHLGTTNVQDVRFLWGTSADALDQTAYAEDFDVSTGAFHATLSSLDENTTYYFTAALQYCTDGTDYLPLEGAVLSFTTASSETGGHAGLQWLGCYEMPAIDLRNEQSYSGTGTETFGSTPWYNYLTNNPMQKVVTHTYAYEGKICRNYTTLVDGDKRCPLWTAYVMHADAYPDNGVGRVGSFSTSHSYDPAIAKEWQSSGSTSDYNNGNGYSRGHHCASADRQATEDANRQTFYYTNQSPQWYNKFNSGVWSSLEESVRSHVPTGRDTLYVVVGTLFEDGNTGSSNDGGTVARPSHFYKLLMKCSFDASGTMTAAKGTAYLYTNEAHTEGSYDTSSFVTTIDAIESRTGFDFFAHVPANLQTVAEQASHSLW